MVRSARVMTLTEGSVFGELYDLKNIQGGKWEGRKSCGRRSDGCVMKRGVDHVSAVSRRLMVEHKGLPDNQRDADCSTKLICLPRTVTHPHIEMESERYFSGMTSRVFQMWLFVIIVSFCNIASWSSLSLSLISFLRHGYSGRESTGHVRNKF